MLHFLTANAAIDKISPYKCADCTIKSDSLAILFVFFDKTVLLGKHSILHSKATPHNCVFGALRKFCALISLQFLVIHQVLLQNSASSVHKILSQIALAELCGVTLKIIEWRYLRESKKRRERGARGGIVASAGVRQECISKSSTCHNNVFI